VSCPAIGDLVDVDCSVPVYGIEMKVESSWSQKMLMILVYFSPLPPPFVIGGTTAYEFAIHMPSET